MNPNSATIRFLTLTLLCPGLTYGGSFTFADGDVFGASTPADIVTHAIGYEPKAVSPPSSFSINVCIVPGTPNETALIIPVQNIVDRYNLLVPVFPNIRFGDLTEFGNIDFESVAIHEMGHCNGLGHSNAASESGLPSDQAESTKARKGANAALNVDAGTDTYYGSPDDSRGDDVNLHYFEIGVNNPFVLPDTVDSSNFSRKASDLPGGDTFAANAEREVAAHVFNVISKDCTSSVSLTDRCIEAIMQQGSGNGETQRALAADDVATLMYARTGVDRVSGNADDYVPTLIYAGISSSSDCDITVAFDDGETGFAVCRSSVSSANWDDGESALALSSSNMYFNNGSNWEFSTTRIPLPVADTATVMAGGTVTSVNGGSARLTDNDTDQNAAVVCSNVAADCVVSSQTFGGSEHGTTTLNANGTFSYTNTNKSATTDRFVYEVCVGSDKSACAHQYVNITITPSNDDWVFGDSFE
jgi:VCBS repeat-containing protein